MRRVLSLALLLVAGTACWPISNTYDARMANGVQVVPGAGTTIFPVNPETGTRSFGANGLGVQLSYGTARITGDLKPIVGLVSGLELGGRIGLVQSGFFNLAVGAHAGGAVPFFSADLEPFPWVNTKLLATFLLGGGSVTVGGHVGALGRQGALDAGGMIGFSAPSSIGEQRVYLTVFGVGDQFPAFTLSYGWAVWPSH